MKKHSAVFCWNLQWLIYLNLFPILWMHDHLNSWFLFSSGVPSCDAKIMGNWPAFSISCVVWKLTVSVRGLVVRLCLSFLFLIHSSQSQQHRLKVAQRAYHACILGSLTTHSFLGRSIGTQLNLITTKSASKSFIWHYRKRAHLRADVLDASIFSDRERPPWESVSSPCNHEGGSCWVTWLLFQSQHKSYSSFRD